MTMDTENPTPPPSTKPTWLTLVWTGLGGAVLGMGIVAFALTRATSKPEPTMAQKPAASNRQLQIVNLYDCQYLVFDPPFTVVHHGGCTNQRHWVSLTSTNR